MAFDKDGVRLASGATDTDIIVWDLIGEIGLFKLRGHKGQITGLSLLDSTPTSPHTNGHLNEDGIDGQADAEADSNSNEILISTSKDALVKVWDLRSQHCVETHVAQSNGECWSMTVSPDQNGLITAGNDGELKVWTVNTG